jgi:O-antigen/teichoic acid export membrane protein
MTSFQHETNRGAGAIRPRGFLGWTPGDRMRLAMRASASSAAGFAVVWGLRFVQQILVGNKIGAGAFGLVGLVSLVIMGLSLLSEIGISQNIVQSRRGDDPELLNTAYTVNAGRGVGLWVVAALLAYPAAWFYNEPSLAMMLIVAGSSMALRGFMSSAVWTLTRHVQVHKLTLLNIVSEVVGFGAALAWVHRDPSAWALIAGSVTASAVYAAGSYFLGPRPRFHYSRAAAGELVSFGSWLLVSTATYFAASQAERLALGKVVTKEELGCFTMAFMMASAPTRAIFQLIEQVYFPMIARLSREDPPRSLLQFTRAKWIALGLSVGASAVCIFGGPFAVEQLLAKEYQPAGWMLQLLGFRAAIEILTGPTVNMLFANGHSKFAGISNVVRLCVLIPGLWIALSGYGMREAVWVLVLAPIPAYMVTLHAMYRHLRAVFRVEVVTFGILLIFSALFGILYRVFF